MTNFLQGVIPLRGTTLDTQPQQPNPAELAVHVGSERPVTLTVKASSGHVREGIKEN